MNPVIWLFLGAICVTGWIAGEALGKRWLRFVFVPLSILIWSFIAAAAMAVHVSLSRGIPFSETVHAFVDETNRQLEAGRVEHVREQLADFRENAPITYEFGTFLNNVRRAIDQMKASDSLEANPATNEGPKN